MNKVILTGVIVTELELKKTATNKTLCRFRLAVKKDYVGKDGQELNEYYSITAWGATAEELVKHSKMGHKLMVEGRLNSHAYDDPKTNEKRYAMNVTAECFDFFKDLNAAYKYNAPPFSEVGTPSSIPF